MISSMALSNNTTPDMGSFQFPYDSLNPFHRTFHCPQQQDPSSSKLQSDLSGFVCNIGPSHHYSSFTPKYNNEDFERADTPTEIQYPSPPPTNSDPKRSVPLPKISSNADLQRYSMPSRHFGGILDSPIITKHEALGCHIPISPPPTLPTPTLDLPPIDDGLPSISEQDDFDGSLLSPGPVEQDGAVHPLLSPLSPEWMTNRITSEMRSPHSDEDWTQVNDPVPPGIFEHYSGLPDHISQPSRPLLPPLEIPHYIPDSPWSSSMSSLMGIDFDDDSKLDTPISPPSSPLLDKPELPDLLFDDGYRDDSFSFHSHPSSPSIHHIHIYPEYDDIPRRSPSSPSLRSFSSLPSPDEDEDDEQLLSPPPSPGRSLLSLPGADTDDDLLPPNLAFPSFDHPDTEPLATAHHSNRSLLLLDDPNDVPPPRSPSPENFHLDPAMLDNCSDPDVHRLCELRKRSQAAERAARQLETLMLEEGSVAMRWEARRTRKREKERSREIATILRLKLAEADTQSPIVSDTGTSESQDVLRSPRTKTNAIRSMEHLVAKMLLRRGDTSRSLADRKTPSFSKFRTRSPLVRTMVLEDEERDSDFDMETEEDDFWSPMAPWPLELDDHGNLMKE